MTFFYNLNKTLDAIREKPETTHGQLNERDMSRAAKGYEKYGKQGMQALAKAGREGKDLDTVRAKYNKYDDKSVEEGFVDAVKSGAQAALGAIGNTMGHGSDEDMIKDLQKKAGLPQTGKVPPQQPGQQPAPGQQPMAEEGSIPMTPKQKSFAAIAPPKDKITFADKIAGAKKEVDEMLGDVAAEAMKNALSGHSTKSLKAASSKDANADRKSGVSPQYSTQQVKGELKRRGEQVADEGNAFTGKLKATPKGGKFTMGNKEYTDTSSVDEAFPTVASARAEMNKRKVGDVTHGAKHDTEETPTGRRVTRRLDPNTGYSVGSDTDDEGNAKSTEKKGRGRPKKTDKAPERVTANATKHKGGRKVKEDDHDSDEVKQAMAMLKKAGYTITKSGAEELEEKAVSKQQQKFMGMVHATQKGEKAPSKAVAKVASTMKKSDATDFASTKHKGLPEKAPEKKEKTEESGTVAGGMAPAAGGKGKAGSMIGKGIYDSLNRDLESMISEGMNVSVSMSSDEHGEPRKSITISADGEAAEQLSQLLNLAGMSQPSSGYEEACSSCGSSNCGCEEIDENQPDWPTDQETIGNDDPLMRRYAGGVNGPKSTGQTTGAPYNSQPQRQGVMSENNDLGMQLYAELKSFKG